MVILEKTNGLSLDDTIEKITFKNSELQMKM